MNKSPDAVALEIRSAGDSLQDSALVEVDLLTGELVWANRFYLERMGLSLSQLRTMTVFDLMPAAFHEAAREALADKSSGRPFRPEIWPSRIAGSDMVAWWYVCQARTVLHRHWSWMELIQETDVSGPGYAFMRVQMTVLSAQVRDRARVDELEAWTHTEVDRLGRDVADLRRDVLDATYAARAAAASSEKAQKAAEEVKAEIGSIKTELVTQFRELKNHESEILRLISSDVGHDKRLQAYESHMRTTSDLAVEAIRKAASDGGRGLSRKVTIPVSLIAALATLIQYLISK